MVAAIIPAAIVGFILLIVGGRLLSGASALFPDANEQARRNEKGAVGNTVDFVAGEGTAQQLEREINQKGIAGAAFDKVYGQGTAARAQEGAASAGDAFSQGYRSFQIATHNAITDPLNLRGIPDLTLAQVNELERRGVNVRERTAQELHDLVLGGALTGAPDAQAPAQQASGGVAPMSMPPLTVGAARGILTEAAA